MKVYFNVIIPAKNMEQYLSINKIFQELFAEKNYLFAESLGFSLYTKKYEINEHAALANIYVTEKKIESGIKKLMGNNGIEILPESIKDSQTLEKLINESLKDKIKTLGL
jgi:hypothetical protein